MVRIPTSKRFKNCDLPPPLHHIDYSKADWSALYGRSAEDLGRALLDTKCLISRPSDVQGLGTGVAGIIAGQNDMPWEDQLMKGVAYGLPTVRSQPGGCPQAPPARKSISKKEANPTLQAPRLARCTHRNFPENDACAIPRKTLKDEPFETTKFDTLNWLHYAANRWLN